MLSKSPKMKSEFKSIGYNYLDDSDISTYFKVEEYFTYYKYLSADGPMRDISEKIIDFSIPFLFSLEDKKIAKKIDEVIKVSIITQRVKIISSINKYAKNINPNGFNLLNIKEDLSFDSLRSSYRDACKKHHPDNGGQIENMHFLNKAYGQFHKLIKTSLLFSTLEKKSVDNILGNYDVHSNIIYSK